MRSLALLYASSRASLDKLRRFGQFIRLQNWKRHVKVLTFLSPGPLYL